MRVRVLVAVTAAGLLHCFAAAGAGPREPQGEAITVEDALDEPVDADDAADIRADDDPNDVGQEALEPAAGTPPVDPAGSEGDADPD